ncbi:MAG: glycosyl hydrolase 53 family protein [Oscillospiraceae bacterium]|nr:glycosyl hydrolase 53 family protein [Oscillospiraceae bacterium]
MKYRKMTAALLSLGLFGTLFTSAPNSPALAAEEVLFSELTDTPFQNGDPFKGVDVSSVISLENSGVIFRNRQGEEQDIFQTLAEAGVNTIRVRIWNHPYNSNTKACYGGGICDADVAEQIAKRCAKAGLKMLLDFHYSDFWADPGKQTAPKEWQNLSVDQKAAAIYQYTKDVLQKIDATGADIAMVQVGNETTTGMCGVMLEKYQWSAEGWNELAKLFNAGAKAVREYRKDTLVVLHFTNPEKASNMNYIAKMLSESHVDYDVFATSYYPYWHGTLSNLTNVLSSVSAAYHKKVMVAETSWLRTMENGDGFANTISSREAMGDYVSYEVSPQGQSAFLHDLFQAVAAVPEGMGIGVFYWEPAWLPVGSNYNQNQMLWEQYGAGWATQSAAEFDKDAGKYYGGSSVDNESLFSWEGVPLDSLYVFSTVHGTASGRNEYGTNLLENGGFEANGGWSDRPFGWELHPTADAHFDVRAEDVRTGAYALHWYSEKAFQNSTARTTVTVKEDGVYECALYLQGDETMQYLLSARTSGGESVNISGNGSGWANWQKPTLDIFARQGETIILELSVYGKDGSYGSADDCTIRLKKEKKTEGDINADGRADMQDAGLLMHYLLTGSQLSDSQAVQADMNQDRKLNGLDLSILLGKLNKKP